MENLHIIVVDDNQQAQAFAASDEPRSIIPDLSGENLIERNADI